jgi:hypothetical protein
VDGALGGPKGADSSVSLIIGLVCGIVMIAIIGGILLKWQMSDDVSLSENCDSFHGQTSNPTFEMWEGISEVENLNPNTLADDIATVLNGVYDESFIPMNF